MKIKLTNWIQEPLIIDADTIKKIGDKLYFYKDDKRIAKYSGDYWIILEEGK